jgi:hypothetical protein
LYQSLSFDTEREKGVQGVFVINQLMIRPAPYQPTVDNQVSVIDS